MRRLFIFGICLALGLPASALAANTAWVSNEKDNSLSLIELKQERLALANTGVRFENPKVEALAQAFGGVGVQAQGEEAVEQAAREALQAGGLRLIEAIIDPAGYRKQM